MGWIFRKQPRGGVPPVKPQQSGMWSLKCPTAASSIRFWHGWNAESCSLYATGDSIWLLWILKDKQRSAASRWRNPSMEHSLLPLNLIIDYLMSCLGVFSAQVPQDQLVKCERLPIKLLLAGLVLNQRFQFHQRTDTQSSIIKKLCVSVTKAALSPPAVQSAGTPTRNTPASVRRLDLKLLLVLNCLRGLQDINKPHRWWQSTGRHRCSCFTPWIGSLGLHFEWTNSSWHARWATRRSLRGGKQWHAVVMLTGRHLDTYMPFWEED